MSNRRVIRIALIAVLAAAALSPAGVYAGSGSHSSGHASTSSGSGKTGGTSGTNRNMTPTAEHVSGKTVGAHPMGFYRCYRACMAGPAGGGMNRFCRAACSR